jgi:hypothetical protein
VGTGTPHRTSRCRRAAASLDTVTSTLATGREPLPCQPASVAAQRHRPRKACTITVDAPIEGPTAAHASVRLGRRLRSG